MTKISRTVSNKEKEIGQLLEIARANWEQDFETSKDYGLRALRNAEDIGSGKLICDSFNVLMVTHYFVGDNEKALHYGFQAMAFLDRENEKQSPSVFNNMGMVYFRLNRLEECLDCYLKSLYYTALFQKNEQIAVNLSNIGGVYWETKTDRFDYQKLEAVKMLKDAMAEGKIVNPLIRDLLVQLDKLDNRDLAYKFFSTALKMFEEHSNNPRLYVNVLYNLGLWNHSMHNLEQAQEYFTKAKQITEKLQMNFLLPNVYLSSAQNYLDMHEYEHAFEDARTAIVLAWKYKIREEYTNGFFLMASIHEGRGKLITALSSMRVHCKLTHSMYVDRHAKDLNLMQERHENEAKNLRLEIDRLKMIVDARCERA